MSIFVCFVTFAQARCGQIITIGQNPESAKFGKKIRSTSKLDPNSVHLARATTNDEPFVTTHFLRKVCSTRAHNARSWTRVKQRQRWPIVDGVPEAAAAALTTLATLAQREALKSDGELSEIAMMTLTSVLIEAAEQPEGEDGEVRAANQAREQSSFDLCIIRSTTPTSAIENDHHLACVQPGKR